jgi:signal transduction histidine kinase
MSQPLHVLILEDQPDDAELVLRELRRAEFDPNWLRVDTEAEYLARLDPRLDVILADYTLPQFNALRALGLLRDRGLDVPFIVVTGTIGEEAAAECIKQGATDYLLKDRLGRLGQAVARGLEDRRLRIQKQQADEALALRTRQLEAARAVTEEITRELDLSVVLNLITQRAVGLLGVGSGAVFLWDTATQRLIPKAWHGLGDWLPEMRLQLGEGVVGTVAQRREGMVVNDYPRSAHSLSTVLARTSAAHALAEPLLYRDRLVGVIGIMSQDPGRPFVEHDRQLLTLFAAQAAIAIENARLYEELREAARQLEARVEERTRELREAMLRAEEALHAKSDFLANMSHELRTPLNSVIGFAGILLMQDVGPLNQKQERFLEHIHQGGKHLLELITDILDLSKVEAGKLTLHPTALSVAGTLEDCLVLARSLSDKNSQTVTADIEADLPTLRADPLRFKQLLFNLLSNAVKFTPGGGTIRLSARRLGGQEACSPTGVPASQPPSLPAGELLEIAVTDTGIGIKAEEMPLLFQEFTQLEPAATKTHEGTGLGLVLTRQLVELHGGRVWAESEGEGRGSTFTVVMPFAGPSDQGTE